MSPRHPYSTRQVREALATLVELGTAMALIARHLVPWRRLTGWSLSASLPPTPPQMPARSGQGGATTAVEKETPSGEFGLRPANRRVRSRREVLTLASVGLGGLAAAIVAVPVLGALVAPLLRPQPPEWRSV